MSFGGGREGYQSLLNTDIKRECDHMAALYRMALDYKRRKQYHDIQFLLEPKPKEPTKHQYDYDAQTTISFLQTYGFADDFKLNIEPNHTTLAGHDAEHDICVASSYNMLGSVGSNTGDTSLGWDTDQFPMDVKTSTAIMSVIINQGGFDKGGLNFDCKVRRESVDPVDLFLGHIGAMDTYARGLRNAAKMKEDGVLESMVKSRYESWDKVDIAQRIEKGEATLEDCVAYAMEKGEPTATSGKQELFEIVRNRYL
jgi:xylose isomerase